MTTCGFVHCTFPAAVIYAPSGKPACRWHHAQLQRALKTRWPDSIIDMVTLADMELRRQERARAATAAASPVLTEIDCRRYTPGQLEQVAVLRRHARRETAR
jgi:hypothetical protein